MPSPCVDRIEREERESAISERSWAELRDYCVRAARRYGARQAAEDVAQDALVAFQAAGQVDRPHAWLDTVVRRLVWRSFRERSTYIGLEEAVGAEVMQVARPTDGLVPLRQVIGRLPARDRRILLLKLQGYSYREMARHLGCRPSAVGTTVHRAFARARRLLRPASASES